MNGTTPTARTWGSGWTRCAGAAALLLLGLVVGGCAHASAVMEPVARALALRRVTGRHPSSSGHETSPTPRARSSQLDAASYETFLQEYNQMVAANLAGPAVSGTGLSLPKAITGS